MDNVMETIRDIGGGVLFPGGYSEGDDLAFAHALRLALAMKTSMTVLAGGKAGGQSFPIRGLLEKWGHLPEGSQPQDVAKLGFWVRKTHSPAPTARKAVLQYLQMQAVDLLVIPATGKAGLLRLGASDPTVKESETAALFLPPSARGFIDPATGTASYSRILVPAAKSPSPQSAINIAFSLARHLEAETGELSLLNIGGDRPEVDLPEDTKWTCDWIDGSGDIVDAIVNAAAETKADMIVMTTSGRRGFFESLLGSTVDKVLERAPCPVLALPAAD